MNLSETSRAVVELLKELLAVPSPSGREERMAALLREKLSTLGYAPETDPAGNVLVRLKGCQADAGTMVLAAHMDEIGMVVTAIETDGSLRVDRSGSLWPYKIGECMVDIIGDDRIVPGVIALGSGHGADAGSRVVTWREVRIATGLSPQRLGELGVRIGSAAVPATSGRGPVLLGDGPDPMIGAWTFDDRGGMIAQLLLLQTLKREQIVPVRPTIVAFTVHEEGGCHGAKVLAHRERPEIFLAVDGCPIQPEMPVVADHRPAVWSKDEKGHYDQRLVKELLRCGRAVGIEVQTAVLGRGACSDATSVYDVGAAPRVAILGHARQSSHGFEYTRLGVFENVAKLLVQFVQQENAA